MLLAKNYFEPKDEGEDYFYHIDSDQNKKYETLESIYNKIFSSKTTQEAKDISLYVRDKNQYVDKSLTYGEVTFRSMAYIFEYCKSRFDINDEGNFVDLGSGIGCAVIAAVLCFSFKKYIGVEFIQALHDKANINKNKFMDMFLDINKEYNDYLPGYIFDEELKNEIVFETTIKEEDKKEESEKHEEEEEKEEEEEEEEEDDKLDAEDNLKNYIMSGKNDAQTILDIIYGSNRNDEDGFMSYVKKSQLRNQKFFEEYEKKLKLEEAKKQKEDQNEKKGGRRMSVHDMIHGINGEGGLLQQLEKFREEHKSESEKEEKSSKKSDKKGKNKSAKSLKKSEKEDKSSTSTSKSKSKSTSKRTILPYIEFNCGNFLKMDLTEASFIFCNSTCFSSELLLLISKKVTKEAPKGCIVITFTKKLPFLNNDEWDIKRGFKRLMSWGLATIFVHRRIKNMNATTRSSGSNKKDSKKDSLYSTKTSKTSSSKTSSSSSSNSNSKSKSSSSKSNS